MKREVQIKILQSCARFVMKRLRPIEERMVALELQLKSAGGQVITRDLSPKPKPHMRFNSETRTWGAVTGHPD